MIDLASLVVRLVADTRRFSGDIDRARGDLNSFGQQAAAIAKRVGVGLAATATAAGLGLLAMAKSAIDAADHLNDLAKATGISTENLSQLQFAAEQSGTDLEGLSTGLRKLAKNAIEAAGGSKGLAEAFGRIGVSVTDSNGRVKDTEALLGDVADAFSQYADGAGKSALAQELFGKTGTALIPFLNNGKRGIKELKEEADRLGLTLSGKTATAADEFNDKLNKLQFAAKGLGLRVAEELLPALNGIVDALSDVATDKDDVNGFIEVLALSLKSAAYLAVAVEDTFKDLGRFLGAFSAYTVQTLQGNFEEAERIEAEFRKNAIAAEEATTKRLDRIWNERAEKQAAALAKYQFEPGRGGPTSRRGGDKTGAKGRFLQQIPIPGADDADELKKQIEQANNLTRTAGEAVLADFDAKVKALDFLRKKAGLGIQEYGQRLKAAQTELLKDISQASPAEEAARKEKERLDDLEKSTRTVAGTILATYRDTRAAIDELLAKKIIDPAEFRARAKEAQDELLTAISQGAPKVEEKTKELNEYQLQAARNTQDIIASTFEGLATGADISAKSILQSFGSMILKLAAQAAAANLAGKLFGEAGGGTKGTTGLLGTALGFFTAKGGSMDSGGRGYPGRAYAIGTGAQPEMFIPDSAGTFVPAGMGGASVQNNFTIVAEEPVSRRTQLQIAAAAARGVARANRRNN